MSENQKTIEAPESLYDRIHRKTELLVDSIDPSESSAAEQLANAVHKMVETLTELVANRDIPEIPRQTYTKHRSSGRIGY